MKIIALLLSRLLLFAFFQGLIALFFRSWTVSVKYWILVATITNVFSIFILNKLLQKKGVRFLSLFRFESCKLKKDLLVFIGVVIICILCVSFSNYGLNKLFYGNTSHYTDVLFQPIPIELAYFLLFAFPTSIAFAELATYFGYIMPLLKSRLKSKILVVLIPAFFLSIQHSTLPLVFEIDFILFRSLVFMPFAILIGVSIYRSPSLLPYFSTFHGILDAMTVLMLIKQINPYE